MRYKYTQYNDLVKMLFLDQLDIFSDAKFILVVEKEATFVRLLDDGALSKLFPCIIVTVSKLFPCIIVTVSLMLVSGYVRPQSVKLSCEFSSQYRV